MAVVLGMMSQRFTQRLGKPVDLACAVDDLAEVGDALADDFDEFFPQLIAFNSKPSQGASKHSSPPALITDIQQTEAAAS